MGAFKAADVGKESDKAARVLKSFIDKGKIPSEIIANSKGIAIFTGVRAGMMYLAGAGGSGVVVARLPDGSWSPPSAFSVRSGSIGIAGGLDVYDCVCVLNTEAAVEAYTKPEVSLGGAIALAAGPINGNANTKNLKPKDIKPIWTYTKSRGLYGGLTVDGTIIKEKSSANADFYGPGITTAQIFRGEVKAELGPNKWPAASKWLIEVLKIAEGKIADERVLQEINIGPTPGDLTE